MTHPTSACEAVPPLERGRSIAPPVAALVAVALLCLVPSAAAGVSPLEDAIKECAITGVRTLATIDPHYRDTLGGSLHIARVWANCAADNGMLVESGALVDDLVDLRALDEFIARARKAADKLTLAIESHGRERLQLLRQAHLASQDYRSMLLVTWVGLGDADYALGVAAVQLIANLDTNIEVYTTTLEEEGLQGTRAYNKTRGFFALGSTLLDRAQQLLEARDDIVRDLPAVAADVREYERLRKLQQRQLEEAHHLLDAAYRAVEKGRKLLARTIQAAEIAAGCELSEPGNPFGGGGWVTISVDGGPEQVSRGDTGLTIFDQQRRFISFGTASAEIPFLIFHHEGRQFRGVGVYRVKEMPSSWGDGFVKDFVNGFFRPTPVVPGRNNFYTLTNGLLEIEMYRLRRSQRLIRGAFDVTASLEGEPDVNVTGRFHLCRFGIERPDGLDLAQ